ncbi:hypothetical protein HME9302_01818 [Alteripontixanthobacter maritimus]|uniref:Polysaccharide deacetylase n=1 Tax=Alteripontixanthobacter maritimus TaxID=2161824 RepID=A0A369QAP8_9SPHN|nr:polysaccharide deacetylase family protein [Alteripontixanthobacter maritimus]RDC60605.1 hypothetical protein HME9302_01818 [Alteripontixanthobacter maritimus]
MTKVYITIDTEYSAALAIAAAGGGQADNYARSIACETPGGAVGIEYQMDVMDAHGLKGVFFVDPLPALLWGTKAIADIVQPIVGRGHDVQLHIHTEWLEIAGNLSFLDDRTGRNMADFSYDDQLEILRYGRRILLEAGAPTPVAFRAGNYGANDDTLRALRWAGLRYDTSHSPAIPDGDCSISLGADDQRTVNHAGAIEVPVGCIRSFGRSLRHAQVTALSAWELLAAIRTARDGGAASFTVVSHSFELLSRDRSTINRIVKRRFERFCAGIARMQGVTTGTYADDPPQVARAGGPRPVLPHSEVRTGLRVAEQLAGNILYGRG